MPWKESEAVSEDNDPVPVKEELGSGQPMTEDVYRMADEALVRWNKELREISDKTDQRLIRQEQDARQSRRFEKRVDSHFEQLLYEEMKVDQHLARQEMDQHLARQEQDARQSRRFEKRVDSHFEQLLYEEMKMDQHLARLEQDARQSRLAMEADGQKQAPGLVSARRAPQQQHKQCVGIALLHARLNPAQPTRPVSA